MKLIFSHSSTQQLHDLLDNGVAVKSLQAYNSDWEQKELYGTFDVPILFCLLCQQINVRLLQFQNEQFFK